MLEKKENEETITQEKATANQQETVQTMANANEETAGQKQGTTWLMTRKSVTVAALLALILVIAGVMMVFSSNNVGQRKVTSGKVSAIEENAEQAGEDKERVGGLDYYNNTVVEETTTEDGKKKFTITNKYKGPIISAEKEVKTATELGYVVEGEEIEYTIIAKNDGGVAKDVVIKDPIVDGLEFVPGSIKVNGSSTYGDIDMSAKTEADLAAGITVNVPAKAGDVTGVTKLSFKATIKNLVGQDLENLQKTIINVAQVDDEEPKIPVVVKKSDVKAGKTATIKKAVAAKAGEEPSKVTVEKDDEITYIITVTNDGEAKAEVNVQDNAPEGTTYIEGTAKIVNKDGSETALDIAELIAGKTIEVDAHDEKKIMFTVKVNDIDNDTIIKNVATVGKDKPEIEHKYIEPVIDVTKTVTKEDGNEIKDPNYVLEGQTIVYRITVTNTGSKETDAVVTDTIPEGLSIVPGSVIIASEETTYTSADLAAGITVNVPAKGKNEEGTEVAGQTIVEFKVTVDELAEGILTKTLKNVAVVTENDKTHEDEVDVTVNKPDLHVTKSVNPGEGTKVKAGDEITYTILLDNSKGTAPTTAKVKDSAPKGTSFKGVVSIKKEDVEETTKTEVQLAEGFDVELAAFESKTVVFTVTVGNKADATEEKVKDGEMISNTAEVNGTPTNTTENHYIEPIITSKKEVTTENGLGYVVKNEKVSYTITAENAGGLAKEITIKDTISEKLTLLTETIVVRVNGTEVDVAKDIENGIVVTVPEKVGETNGIVTVTFDTTVKEDASGEITNVAIVDGTDTPVDENLPILTFNKKAEITRTTQASQTIADGSVTTNDEIKYTIKVTNSGEETANSITVKDRVPEGTRLKENSVSDNGNIVDNKDITWTITNLEPGQSKEVNFTVIVNYSEKDGTIRNTAYVADEPTNTPETPYEKPTGRVDDTMTKTGTEQITKEDAEVTYNVNYTTKVNDYVGDAEVTVVDTLPYAIDETKSDLAGGRYDAETRTITWTNTVAGIDTYTNGEKTITVEKTIKVVFVNMDYSKTTFTNKVVGKTTLKYLDDEEPVTHPEKEATAETTTDFRASVEVEKQWNHTNNIYGNPESVTIELLANGVKVQEATLTMANKVGEDENTWSYTFTNLEKYDAEGNRITYTVREK